LKNSFLTFLHIAADGLDKSSLDPSPLPSCLIQAIREMYQCMPITVINLTAVIRLHCKVAVKGAILSRCLALSASVASLAICPPRFSVLF